MTSANRQQSVDVVDHCQVWSARENQRFDIVWMSPQSHISLSVRPRSFDTCHSALSCVVQQ